MSAGRTFEVVDEPVHFLIGHCPIKVAVRVLNVAVE
jgi:hypothetical protein